MDAVLSGRAPEQAILSWTRRNRFAGSKDRAALRDIVFSVERRRASCAAMGGGSDGRALLRGYLAQEGIAEQTVFGAGRYAPDPIGPRDAPLRAWSEIDVSAQRDLQPWVWDTLHRTYGAQAAPIAEALRHRAPVWLRANLARIAPEALSDELKTRGFAPQRSTLCDTAIRIESNTRQLAQDDALAQGFAEFQDLGPQIAVADLAVTPGTEVLDFCAGGGGKALACAALGARVTAHDADPRRMSDLPQRAARAGAHIAITASPNDPNEAAFDLVICDVPCSGSGAWRRAVAGKWSFSASDLARVVATQRSIVAEAARFVKPGGRLAYMTCALFAEENAQQADVFAQTMTRLRQRQLTPLEGSDGFFAAIFTL